MSEPYKIFRGRPPKDKNWNALVAKSPHIIDNDEVEDGILRENVIDGLPRGCVKFFKKEYYYCNFYIGGAQRHIAKGTLYQCAKFYDYALIFFDKYRVRKAVTKFNFDRADDEAEMSLEPQIAEYFSQLEKYLLQSGALVLREARKQAREARSYKKTIAGTIETWMNELQPYIEEIANNQDDVMKTLKTIETRLSAIETHLRITPA